MTLENPPSSTGHTNFIHAGFSSQSVFGCMYIVSGPPVFLPRFELPSQKTPRPGSLPKMIPGLVRISMTGWGGPRVGIRKRRSPASFLGHWNGLFCLEMRTQQLFQGILSKAKYLKLKTPTLRQSSKHPGFFQGDSGAKPSSVFRSHFQVQPRKTSS